MNKEKQTTERQLHTPQSINIFTHTQSYACKRVPLSVYALSSLLDIYVYTKPELISKYFRFYLYVRNEHNSNIIKRVPKLTLTT